jgi:retron-type reverse transcriptase
MFQFVQQPANGMIDYFETISQPITKAMVFKAYGNVGANKGGAGMDGMTWVELDANLPRYLFRLWNRLISGSYFPAPVLQVEIPKKSGGVRPLVIPTLLDRIVQQVVPDHLEKQF